MLRATHVSGAAVEYMCEPDRYSSNLAYIGYLFIFAATRLALLAWPWALLWARNAGASAVCTAFMLLLVYELGSVAPQSMRRRWCMC